MRVFVLFWALLSTPIVWAAPIFGSGCVDSPAIPNCNLATAFGAPNIVGAVPGSHSAYDATTDAYSVLINGLPTPDGAKRFYSTSAAGDVFHFTGLLALQVLIDADGTFEGSGPVAFFGDVGNGIETLMLGHTVAAGLATGFDGVFGGNLEIGIKTDFLSDFLGSMGDLVLFLDPINFHYTGQPFANDLKCDYSGAPNSNCTYTSDPGISPLRVAVAEPSDLAILLGGLVGFGLLRRSPTSALRRVT
jgi:hypothetical protein